MKVTTKYSLEDMVWYMSQNRPQCGKVTYVYVRVTGKDQYSIYDGEFKGFDKNRKVIIPSATYIQGNAFNGCDSLETVIIRDIMPKTSK